jgi:tRNA pseudouridine(55) synthase
VRPVAEELQRRRKGDQLEVYEVSWSKAGHTGTLDPLATGLLPICLGEATKFSHALLDADKSYEAIIQLGFISSTGDAEGDIQPYGKPDFSEARLHQVLASFVGPIDQIPPMHSALKKDGKPLYSYARAGGTVARIPRKIIINSLQLVDKEGEVLKISVGCSKGTYIRVLAEDIGKSLGCGGYLLALRRTGIRDLRLEDAIGLDQLGELDESSKAARLLPVDRLGRISSRHQSRSGGKPANRKRTCRFDRWGGRRTCQAVRCSRGIYGRGGKTRGWHAYSETSGFQFADIK